MHCNIDQRGRRSRIISGAIVDLIGIGIFVIGVMRDNLGALIAGGVLSLVGAFMIFEGVRGWCALRAMGVKTPL